MNFLVRVAQWVNDMLASSLPTPDDKAKADARQESQEREVGERNPVLLCHALPCSATRPAIPVALIAPLAACLASFRSLVRRVVDGDACPSLLRR